MIHNVWLAISIAGGAVAGLGVYLFIAQLLPSSPALGPALQRLHPAPEVVINREPATAGTWRSPIALPQADLEILGRTEQQHVTHVLLTAATVSVFPILLTIFGYVLGLSIPFVVPIGVTLVVAGCAALMTHYNMRASASEARSEFVRALCTYAALTAHQVRSGHGAVEAMERSARICDGWPYVRMRNALLTAQLQMRPPWDELKTLSAAIEVVELTSFADIMRSAGNDGAQVYQTLRAQAASLRDHVRAKALERAKTRTSKLDVPSTVLVIILLVLVGYPLMMSLFSQQ